MAALSGAPGPAPEICAVLSPLYSRHSNRPRALADDGRMPDGFG